MRRFVEEADRGQWTLLPECLDDFIDESNPVRVIDVFVDALDLAEMGFDGVEPAATGRPSYHPSVLLKLYIYGYPTRFARLIFAFAGQGSTEVPLAFPGLRCSWLLSDSDGEHRRCPTQPSNPRPSRDWRP